MRHLLYAPFLALLLTVVWGTAGQRSLAMPPFDEVSAWGEIPGQFARPARATANRASDARNAPDLHAAAAAALSADPESARRAIAELRGSGPDGIAAMVATHQDLVAALSQQIPPEKPQTTKAPQRITVDSTRVARFKAALDAVAGQYDAHASRLFWYTDIDAARDAAQRENKPILTLRLLGKLTDQYSCANSRFFRSTLYVNAEVNRLLRENFILHWESVRPVPVVTIDFGDGRQLKRTLTGNSVHYVLDSRGRSVDALPGLYGAKVFISELNRARQLAAQTIALDGPSRAAALREYHADRSRKIAQLWEADLKRIGALPSAVAPPGVVPPVVAPVVTASSTAAPEADTRFVSSSAPPARAQAPAVAANAIAAPKAAAERPLLAAAVVDPAALNAASTDEVWARIAALHADVAQLDAASRSFIIAQKPDAGRAGERAITKRVVEDPLLVLVRTLQQSIAIDTVRNEFQLHRQIHEWFVADPEALVPLKSFNNRVYAELFLSPTNDQWYGLMPDGVYTALNENGVCSTD